MARYIDRDAIVQDMKERLNNVNHGDYIYYQFAYKLAIRYIENAPTVDVQEVKHAKWVPDKKREGIVICSECKRGECCDWFRDNYCSHCGAKMLEDE